VRVDSLMSVRALMLAGAANFDEFQMSLKTMEVPFMASVKDLRSQVKGCLHETRIFGRRTQLVGRHN
jgi:hypothetical protein